MDNKTCSFAGHANIFNKEELKIRLKKSYLVRAYMPTRKDSYEEDLYKQIFDSTIYPEIENIPRRLAI